MDCTWIENDFRKPSNDREVLVYTRIGKHFLATYSDKLEGWYSNGKDISDLVTRWCELPKTPGRCQHCGQVKY
jgi:hypothetical protein